MTEKQIDLDGVITELQTEYPIFYGPASTRPYTADFCRKCKKTVNRIAYAKEWVCECGETNLPFITWFFNPHDNPDMGPSKALIDRAVAVIREKEGQKGPI